VDSLIGILFFAVGILISIGLHEIGHLVPAKKFGVRVPTYMVGFGPTVWSKIKGETEYGLKLIPLGGYIRMIGMYPPNPKGEVDRDKLGRMGNLIEEARTETFLEIADEDSDRVFYKLSVPKKLTVMFGGPFMNLVIATVLFFVTLAGVGLSAPSTTLANVSACVPTAANPNGIISTDGTCGEGTATAAAKAGLKAGDELLTINSIAITKWEDVSGSLTGKIGQVVPIEVLRNGQTVQLTATVGSIQDSPNGSRPFLGISPALEMVRMPASEVPAEMWNITVLSVKGLMGFPAEVLNLGQELFTEAPRNVEGPVSVIGVGRISGQITSADAISNLDKISILLLLLASVNLFLFLFNLVPILPLDGGHMAVAIADSIRAFFARLRGRPRPAPIDVTVLTPITMVVFVVLATLTLLLLVADVINPVTLNL